MFPSSPNNPESILFASPSSLSARGSVSLSPEPATPAATDQPQRPPVRKANSALANSGLANSAFQRPKVQKGSFSISVFDNHGGSYDIRNSNNNNNSGGGVEVQNHGGIRFPNFQTQYGSVFHTQQT